jgi:hypothetical protein
MRAIVLTFDRHRAITQHMILQYQRLWPDHPFCFRVPYQNLGGINSDQLEYIKTRGDTPEDIPAAVLQLLADLPDEEWVYWCSDDKYPIRLEIERIGELMTYALETADISGLLFCRTRVTLDQPELTLYPNEQVTASGDVLLERRSWYQIWIHQFLRVKVLRYFFTKMPPHPPSAKAMDELKNAIVKPDDFRLFVTKKNFAVFGESTQRGRITRNCFDSIKRSGIELPEWFRRSNGQYVTMGELPGGHRSWTRWMKRLLPVSRRKRI